MYLCLPLQLLISCNQSWNNLVFRESVKACFSAEEQKCIQYEVSQLEPYVSHCSSHIVQKFLEEVQQMILLQVHLSMIHFE